MASSSGRRSPRVLWSVAALAVTVVAVLAWGAFGGQQSPQTTDRQEQTGSQNGGMSEQLKALQRREAGDPFAMGRADAPVVLVEYEDFRCPFCSKFATDVEPQLIERYVKTGVLRIEWRDFPIFGEESLEMAKAGRAAARQGKFWQFHDIAYSMGSTTEKASFPEERIQQIAREAGISDLAKFNADRGDPTIMQEIQTDMAEGQRLGVSSVPSFIVNSQPILGAQPLEQFTSVIEQERAKS